MTGWQMNWFRDVLVQVQAVPFAITLATEIAILVVLLAALTRVVPPGKRRRTLWRGAIAFSALLLFAEATGAGEFVWRVASLLLRPTQSPPVTGSNTPLIPDLELPTPVPVAPAFSASSLLFAIWALGTLTSLFHIVYQRVRLRFIAREMEPLVQGSLPESIKEIAQSFGMKVPRAGRLSRLEGPIVFGVVHPSLVVPDDFEIRFSKVEQRAVLAHELEHLASRDPLWKLMGDIVISLLWWHPFVWWMAQQNKVASEEAADEACLALPHGALHLAQGLVRLAEHFVQSNVHAAHSVASSPQTLSKRVEWLLSLEYRGKDADIESRMQKLMRMFAAPIIVCCALAGAGFCRADCSNTAGSASNWSSCWQQSFLGVVLSAFETVEPQVYVMVAETDRKTDEKAADYMNLKGNQRKKYFNLLEENYRRLKEFQAIQDYTTKRVEGLKFNRWWRDSLKATLTAGEYAAYLKYWDTEESPDGNLRSTQPALYAPAKPRSPRRAKVAGPKAANESPEAASRRLALELGLSEEQERLISELNSKLIEMQKDVAAVVEKNNSKDGKTQKELRDFQIYSMEEINNFQVRSMKKILTKDQQEKYQRLRDRVVVPLVRPISAASAVGAISLDD